MTTDIYRHDELIESIPTGKTKKFDVDCKPPFSFRNWLKDIFRRRKTPPTIIYELEVVDRTDSNNWATITTKPKSGELKKTKSYPVGKDLQEIKEVPCLKVDVYTVRSKIQGSLEEI